MMEKMIRRGEKLAEKKAARARAELKSALQEELPDHISIEETGDGVELRAKNLSHDLIENSSLRDVAFLMRGVR